MTKPLVVLAIAAAAAALPAVASAADSRPGPRIVVSGEGEATIAPDVAVLTLSVMREAKTAREALDANNDAMAAVIAAMKSAGIADRDLQTAGIQISPRYTYSDKPEGGQTAELVAYQVSNTLSVRVRDIDRTGEILDKAVTLGVNQGGDVSFTNENPEAAMTQARKQAMADAVAKAKTLAEAAGASLGMVLEISDQNFRPMPMAMAAAPRSFDAAGKVPMQPGENTYHVQVNVTFELK